MHNARHWFIAGQPRGKDLRLECKHPGCDYGPPEDNTVRVQRRAFRQHRIDMGEHPADLKVQWSVSLTEPAADLFDSLLEMVPDPVEPDNPDGRMSRGQFLLHLMQAELERYRRGETCFLTPRDPSAGEGDAAEGEQGNVAATQ